jgi:glycosyltransferase involved in cell wall biosynthesis
MTLDRTAPTVAIALHDGFYGCGTGAGRSNRAFLSALDATLHPAVRLLLLPVHLAPPSPEYDSDWYRRTLASLRSRPLDVRPIDNGTAGRARFGGLRNFRILCAGTAQALEQFAARGQAPRLVIALDTPFHGLAPLLPAPMGVRLVVVPRSTGDHHEPDNEERRRWEAAGLAATWRGGGRIAAISHHMRTCLTGTYRIPALAIVDLPNGLVPAERPPPARPRPALPHAAHGGFLLAMGRAHPYKGFDDLLHALAVLPGRLTRPCPHLLLAAVTEDPEPNAYQRHLARLIERRGLDTTLLTRFDATLPALLHHPALRGVVVPSRSEPFGRVPLEAFAAGAAPVVATTAGGLPELVRDGHTGYTAPPGDPNRLADALARALAATPAEHDRHRAAGLAALHTRHDYVRTVSRFLTQLAPDLTRPADADDVTRRR